MDYTNVRGGSIPLIRIVAFSFTETLHAKALRCHSSFAGQTFLIVPAWATCECSAGYTSDRLSSNFFAVSVSVRRVRLQCFAENAHSSGRLKLFFQPLPPNVARHSPWKVAKMHRLTESDGRTVLAVEGMH